MVGYWLYIVVSKQFVAACMLFANGCEVVCVYINNIYIYKYIGADRERKSKNYQ